MDAKRVNYLIQAAIGVSVAQLAQVLDAVSEETKQLLIADTKEGDVPSRFQGLGEVIAVLVQEEGFLHEHRN